MTDGQCAKGDSCGMKPDQRTSGKRRWSIIIADRDSKMKTKVMVRKGSNRSGKKYKPHASISIGGNARLDRLVQTSTHRKIVSMVTNASTCMKRMVLTGGIFWSD